MSVQLDPQELGYRRMCRLHGVLLSVPDKLASGPFTNEVTQLLRLGNPSNDPIAFKVR